MELPPRPISSRSYHDAHLTSVTWAGESVLLMLKDITGQSARIALSGIHLFFLTEVLAQNVIERVDCHEVTLGNIDSILNVFRRTRSEYLSNDALERTRRAGGLVGAKFLSVHPTYGALLIALCDHVVEEQ